MQEFLNAITLLPDKYKKHLMNLPENICESVNEIRFRVGEAVSVCTSDTIYYISPYGRLTQAYCRELLKTDEKDMQEIVFALSRRSMHTYQDMIVQGYIPLYGGCRAGVAGRAVMRNGSVYSLSAFNSVNIRVSREFSGCSKSLTEAMGETLSYLIVGQPMSGKTTLLRDLCRFYSNGNSLAPKKVAVIDERDEIASRTFGHSIDVGAHTDVLTLYPKAIGTEIALRTLSPDIIILDEIGTEQESRALLAGMNSGVDFIATAHGSSLEQVLRRPNIKTLVNGGVFKKAVILWDKSKPCQVKELINL